MPGCAITPRGMDPSYGGKPLVGTTQMGPERWARFLGDIAAGAKLAEAMQKHLVTRADIEAIVRLDPKAAEAWEEARTVAMRTTWSTLDLEELFTHVAAGKPLCEAVQLVRGEGATYYTQILRLLVRDPTINAQYRRALEMRSLHAQDEILGLADDKEGDVLHNDKGPAGNVAAVNRSKLQVETRLRLMAAWNTRMFGQNRPDVQVNVQVNHAERLEEARSRRDSRHVEVSPREVRKAIDASFSAVTEQKEGTEWMDEPSKQTAGQPVDAAWLDQ